MSDLPFELSKKHKVHTKANWKRLGVITDNFEEIYIKYIHASHCELCNKEFKSSRERHMEHCHTTGKFRNITCNSCNHLKNDFKFTTKNTSGYRCISKVKDIRKKQGFYWEFKVHIDGKNKHIKQSVDFDKLVKFADQWKKDNNYHK